MKTSRGRTLLALVFSLAGAKFHAACSDDTGAVDAGHDDAAAADAPSVPDTGPEPDAGHDDAMPPDLGFGDAGPPPDVGERFNASECLTCSNSMPCPGAGACLTANRQSFCADRCDSDLFGCVGGFICYDITAGMGTPQYFCVPPSASCTMPGTGFGAECFGDSSACLMAQDRCEGDFFAPGYCTEGCGMNSDCPPGWDCLTGDDGDSVCKPSFASRAEQCARLESPDELPCAVDSDCYSIDQSAICVRSEPTLPGVCAKRCMRGGAPDCALGTCLGTLRGDACLTDNCLCHGSAVPAGTRDLFQEALAAVGLSRCGTTFGIFDWSAVPPDILHDPYRLGFYDQVHDEPLRAPAWGREVVGLFDAEAAQTVPPTARAARMVEHLAALLDRPAVTHPAGTIDAADPLARAVAGLITLGGGRPDFPQLQTDAALVPRDLQVALAGIVDAMQRAAIARKTAIENDLPNSVAALYEYGGAFTVPRADGFGLSPANAQNAMIFNTGFKYGEMYGAAVDVLDAIADADLMRFRVVPTATVATSSAAYVFAADTPYGRVAIGDGEPGIYDSRDPAHAGPWALLVDLGGNDVYRTPVAGNTSVENAVSIMIDLGGDDEYGYVEVPDPRDGTRLPSDGGGRYAPRTDPTMDNGPISLSDVARQGGARMGTAILVDLGGGKDRYTSLRMSQGSGIFGAGVLVDDGGDDTYVAETMAQGAGEFGIGLLFDLGGDDVHRAYSFAQGFGFARGGGLVYDVSGADQYLMDVGDPASGGDPLYFNAQRPGRANSTLGQGFAFGRRADQDHAYMSGGIGLLIDAAGDDRYEGSIFAQGGGYWFGTGILADESGDDHYDAMWYAMGTGAHYSLGLLLEGAGNDVYGGVFPRVNVTIAGGHDYSAAWLIDESGNDIYNGSRITIGSGNSNGMGFLVDNGGDDQYSANSPYSIGAGGLLGSDVDYPGSPRHSIDVVGIFVDAAGADTYTRAMMPAAGLGDDMHWVQTQNMDPLVNRIEKGAGVDGAGESGFHARWP